MSTENHAQQSDENQHPKQPVPGVANMLREARNDEYKGASKEEIDRALRKMSKEMREILQQDTQDAIDYNKRRETQKGIFMVKKSYQWLEDAMQEPVPTMLFDKFWYEGEVCILFADTNTGKSILAVQIANSISRGEAIEGFKLDKTEPQKVVYFDFELFKKQFELRYSNNYADHYVFHPYFYRAELNPDDDVPLGCESFDECLKLSLDITIRETEAKVLVVDNITYLKNQTEQAKDALPLMKDLQALKRQFGLSILVLAHTPKRDLTKPMTRNDLQGSKMLINFCDSSFCIGESTQEKGLRYLKQIKARSTEIVYDQKNVVLCRIDKPHNFLGFYFTGYANEYEHLKTPNKDDDNRAYLIQRAKELIGEGMSERDVARELGISKTTVSNYKNM